MASDSLTDQDWEAARLAVRGAFERNVELLPPILGEPKEILKFLYHHLDLHGAGVDHMSSIAFALEAIHVMNGTDHLTVECVKDINCASPSFVRGVRSIMRPDSHLHLRGKTTTLFYLMSDQWFDSPVPVMEPEEMSEFCEHLAVYMIDNVVHVPLIQKRGVTILFGMLSSPEWRKHIVPRFWSMFACCILVEEGRESFRWCLRNAIELLEFTRGLPDGEGLKWWYGTLWFHYDKLDTTVRSDVEKIARDMASNDGLSDLNLYLNLIGREVARTRQEVDEIPNEGWVGGSINMKLRARLIALEGNYHRLSRITGGQL
jgi:hypothetical protein